MSLQYIRDHYQVPAEEGRRVAYTDAKGTREGVITGATNQYLNIHFDGEKRPKGVFHPTHGIQYLGMGKVPRLTASQIRWQRYREIGDCFHSFRDFLGYLQREKQAHDLGFSSVSEHDRDFQRRCA